MAASKSTVMALSYCRIGPGGVRIRNWPDRERLIPLDQIDHFELLYRGVYLSSIQRVDLTIRSGYHGRLEQLMVILNSGRRIRIRGYRGADKQRAADWLNDELTRFLAR